MTTITAWAAVDRGVSAVYIASDSRITWGQGDLWDRGRKTFASHTEPYVFGYWGDVLFPAMALPQVIESIDHNLVPLNANRPYGPVGSLIRRLWLDYPISQRRDCGILLAHRLGSGMKSVFSLAVFTYGAKEDKWRRRSIPMPDRSAELRIAGSGTAVVRNAKKLWDDSPHRHTSRAVYSAFCEGLASGQDPLSGGGPQLVRLRRMGNGETLGATIGASRFFAGAKVRSSDVTLGVDWFNELFERIDGATLKRLAGAQVHQPR